MSDGFTNTLWRINLDQAMQGVSEWQNITNKTKNFPLYSFSYHVAVNYSDKIYFYGGSRSYTGPVNKFVAGFRKAKMEMPETISILDLKSMIWSTGQTLGKPRDDFASTFD